MIDWTKSMLQTFEYYIVNPNTWKDETLLPNVKSCAINWDSDAATLGSATIDVTESVGECIVRIYLKVTQDGITERFPLGTFLVQTPSSSFDGKVRNVSMDAYTPLTELKEGMPPIGYYIPKTTYYEVQLEGEDYVVTENKLNNPVGTLLEGVRTTTGKQIYKQTNQDDTVTYYCLDETIIDHMYRLIRENARAPVVHAECSHPLNADFVADIDDSWLSYLGDLLSVANYEFLLDEQGRILFAPKQDIASLQPVWTYNDDNSSILYPELRMNHDLYGIPNVVEIMYSGEHGRLYAQAINDDPNSPTSTVRRGRKIVYRETKPNLVGIPTQAQIDELAEQTLRALSSVEYTINYSHGYCPVRVGDCVRLNYTRAGIKDIKAKVISQSISCGSGCKVTETAVFTNKLWR